MPTWVDNPSPPPRPAPAAQPIAPNLPGAQGAPGPAPGPQPSAPNPATPLSIPVPTFSAQPLPVLPLTSTGGLLGSARGDFTRAARSGGGRALRRSAGKYVHAVGGASSAAQSMGPSRRTATGLGQFLGDVVQRGSVAALQPFSLDSLAGSPATEVFIALTDVLCPDGGTIDEAIARNAMLETAAELATAGDVAFDSLTATQLEAFFLGTISRSIEGKLFNELGGSAVRLPQDVAAVRRVERMLHDYIQGAVQDAFAGTGQALATMPRADVDRFVQTIYEQSYALLQVLGDEA